MLRDLPKSLSHPLRPPAKWIREGRSITAEYMHASCHWPGIKRQQLGGPERRSYLPVRRGFFLIHFLQKSHQIHATQTAQCKILSNFTSVGNWWCIRADNEPVRETQMLELSWKAPGCRNSHSTFKMLPCLPIVYTYAFQHACMCVVAPNLVWPWVLEMWVGLTEMWRKCKTHSRSEEPLPKNI